MLRRIQLLPDIHSSTRRIAANVIGMDLGLADARALVMAGSGGLGRAVALALAGEGARVAIAARAGEKLEAAARDASGLAIGVDLASADGPRTAVESAIAQLGGLDALLVNMGGPPPGRFDEVTDEAWVKALEMTFWSTIRAIRAALPALAESAATGRGGAICIILSSSVREPIPALITSNVLRPGLAGLVKSLVPEIAPVRINGIAPGRVATDRIASLDRGRAERSGISVKEVEQQTIARIPLGRYGEPAEIGRVAAFLLSPAASYVTGAIVPVDGGMVKALP
jgi:3-oxoacyl-[acyl-carrier protein] reductase